MLELEGGDKLQLILPSGGVDIQDHLEVSRLVEVDCNSVEVDCNSEEVGCIQVVDYIHKGYYTPAGVQYVPEVVDYCQRVVDCILRVVDAEHCSRCVL